MKILAINGTMRKHGTTTKLTEQALKGVSAGLVPDEMRAHCDLATPWLKYCASMICNGTSTGDLFAGAHYEKNLTGKDHQQAFLFKSVSEKQLESACQIGEDMVKSINEKRIQPYDPMME